MRTLLLIGGVTCVFVASLGLSGCGENENDRALRASNELMADASHQATVKYIRDHRDLYTESFSSIKCADTQFVGWNCWALFDGGQSCYEFVVVGNTVEPREPEPLSTDCAKPHPVAPK